MSNPTVLTTLIQDLQKSRAAIALFSTQIPGMEAIAEEVSKILRSARPGSQLAAELGNLWTSFPRPETGLFVIQPFSSVPTKGKVAWLQLLVLSAQGHARHRRRVIPDRLGPSLKDLAEVAAKARRGLSAYVRDRGAITVANQLIDALEWLTGILPRGIELDGRHLVREGQRIATPLTPNERTFMNLLIQANEQEVTRSKLMAEGITHPAETKSRLVRKPAFQFLSEHILAGQSGGYWLRQN